MKSITDFALNNSRTVILSMVLIVLGGAYLFTQVPKLEDPPITIREALVSAQYPGMPVEQVERLITDPLRKNCERWEKWMTSKIPLPKSVNV